MDSKTSAKNKITAYFNGQLPPSEEAGLFDWINKKKENKELFFELKQKLEPNGMQHPMLEKSFIELKNKLYLNQQFKSRKKVKAKGLVLSVSRVAAILIVALILGFSLAYITGISIKNKEIVWFETRVPRGEKSQLLLPDGSKIWVNAESSVLYPSNFMDGNRQIRLNGEAYFEIAKHKGKPFTIETHDFNIRVLGTKFNVMAYKDFNRTETTLIEGKIQVHRGKQIIDIVPGQTFTYKNGKYFTKTTNASKSAKWKDHVFDFDKITFKELIMRLERWYDVDIDIKSKDLDNILYSGVFKNEETIDQVLTTFQLTMPISYSKDDFKKFSIQLKL